MALLDYDVSACMALTVTFVQEALLYVYFMRSNEISVLLLAAVIVVFYRFMLVNYDVQLESRSLAWWIA